MWKLSRLILENYLKKKIYKTIMQILCTQENSRAQPYSIVVLQRGNYFRGSTNSFSLTTFTHFISNSYAASSFERCDKCSCDFENI